MSLIRFPECLNGVVMNFQAYLIVADRDSAVFAMHLYAPWVRSTLLPICAAVSLDPMALTMFRVQCYDSLDLALPFQAVNSFAWLASLLLCCCLSSGQACLCQYWNVYNLATFGRMCTCYCSSTVLAGMADVEFAM